MGVSPFRRGAETLLESFPRLVAPALRTGPLNMSKDDDSKSGKRWFPLESNPEVMNAYIGKLGFPISEYKFTDVFSTEDWALEMVPSPVLAVLFLYPIKESVESFRRSEDEKIKSQGQVVSDKVYYMKQTVGNACGTVALLHAAGNALGTVSYEEGSYLANFFNKTKELEPDRIAEVLEEDDEIEEVHEEAAQEGQSEQIAQGEVDTHFICFVEKDGSLYELDGRKSFPINHGPSAPTTVLQDAIKVIKGFIDRDPGEVRFTIVALSPATDDA